MKVGMIGLGAMGAPMALNLHRANYLSALWNRTPANAVTVCQQTGIALSQSIESLVDACDVIVISVSADPDLLEVVEKIAHCACPQTIVIDTSTVSAQTAQQAARQLAKRQIQFVDAPVSGGVEGAQSAQLSIMLGGDQQVVQTITPVLQALGTRITYMGAVGNGQATKAVNQIMVAGINLAVSEALSFAKRMQLPMDKVIEAVSGGAAANWFLNHRGPTMIKGEFSPGFRVRLHDKDLGICQAMARQQGHPKAMMVEQIRALYAQLIEQGFADEDISALYRTKSDF